MAGGGAVFLEPVPAVAFLSPSFCRAVRGSLYSTVRDELKEAHKRGGGQDEVPTFVSGGPDGSVDGPFFIFNRALLAQLAVEGRWVASSPSVRSEKTT